MSASLKPTQRNDGKRRVRNPSGGGSRKQNMLNSSEGSRRSRIGRSTKKMMQPQPQRQTEEKNGQTSVLRWWSARGILRASSGFMASRQTMKLPRCGKSREHSNTIVDSSLLVGRCRRPMYRHVEATARRAGTKWTRLIVRSLHHRQRTYSARHKPARGDDVQPVVVMLQSLPYVNRTQAK